MLTDPSLKSKSTPSGTVSDLEELPILLSLLCRVLLCSKNRKVESEGKYQVEPRSDILVALGRVEVSNPFNKRSCDSPQAGRFKIYPQESRMD